MSDYSDGSDGGGYNFDDQRDSDVSRGSDDEEGNSFEGFLDEDAPDMDSNAASGDESDGDESGQSETGGTNLLDMEAVETDEEGDEDSDSDDTSRTLSASNSDSGHHSRSITTTFPLFSRLPAELREMIWREFCPDLIAKSRVFELQLVKVKLSEHGYEVWESAVTDEQTQPIRALACTCRESRDLVLGAFPDTLQLHGSWKYRPFRINLDKDMVFLTVIAGTTACTIPGFTDKVKHLALDSSYVQGPFPVAAFGVMQADAHQLLECFSKLETVYCCYPHSDPFGGHGRDMAWLKANMLNVHHVQTHEAQPGLGENLSYLYCWPAEATLKTVKSVIYPASKKDEALKGPELVEGDNGDDDDDDDDNDDLQSDDDDDEDNDDYDAERDREARLQSVVAHHEDYGYWYLPMLNFQYEDGLSLFNAVMRWKEFGDDLSQPDFDYDESDYSESEEDNGSDLEGFIAEEDDEDGEEDEEDDQEDGDDNGPDIVDLAQDLEDDGNSVASDDYDLSLSSPYRVRPRVEELFDSEHDSEEGSEDGGGSVGREFADDFGDAELPAADFSSPEPNAANDSDSESTSDKSEAAVRVVSRPKRHIVLSDDDEDDDDDEVGGSDQIASAVEKPQQRAKRRIESSDAEDDEDPDDIGNTVRSRPAKRARIIDSESEDEDED